jgi:hypothetical protein
VDRVVSQNHDFTNHRVLLNKTMAAGSYRVMQLEPY